MPTRRHLLALVALLLLALPAGCALLPPVRGPIVYTRSGGFIGFADSLVIAPDGSAVLTDRGVETRFEVPAATLAELEAAFAASDVRNLPESTPPPGSADMFEYSFTWRGHTLWVTAIPEALAPAAAILSDLVEAHRAP